MSGKKGRAIFAVFGIFSKLGRGGKASANSLRWMDRASNRSSIEVSAVGGFA
jgi:hypothetical protein